MRTATQTIRGQWVLGASLGLAVAAVLFVSQPSWVTTGQAIAVLAVLLVSALTAGRLLPRYRDGISAFVLPIGIAVVMSFLGWQLASWAFGNA